MKKFKAKYPDYSDHYYLVNEDRPNNIEKKFDLIISVEVMEHVSDLDFYLDQINSLLKKGGYFIWTTPCANWFSIEHIYSLITGKIEKTKEGYRKWTWEDPTHLRRLKSSEIKSLLQLRGFSNIKFRFRAHLFSYLCTNWPILRKKIISNRLFNLDYYLFRYLPNGASMIGSAKKV